MLVSPRHLEILKYVNANPGCSTNAVYVSTSPVCQATGRRRTMGTSNWTIPLTLTSLGLVKIKSDYTLVENAVQKRLNETANNGNSYHRFRHLIRYHWQLTAKGKKAVAAYDKVH